MEVQTPKKKNLKKTTVSASKSFAENSMFEYLAEGILKSFPALQSIDSNTFFQFAGKPITADWGDGKEYPAWTRGNIVPADMEGFYNESTALVANAYKNFIASIAPADFELTDQYKGYQIRLDDLSTEYSTLTKNAFDAYTAFTKRFPEIAKGIDYETWLGKAGTEGPSYNAKLQANLAQQAVIIAEIAAYMKAVNAPLSAAQDAVNDTGNLQTFVVGGTTQTGLITTLEDLNAAVKIWNTRPVDGPFDLDVTINKNVVETGAWEKVVNTSVQTECFSISSEKTVDYKRVLMDTNFNMQIQAIGANTFGISRGTGWFDSSWLRASNVKFPEGSRFAMSDFFGPTGTLKLVPTRAFVIYKPKVTITVSKTTYTQTVKKWYKQGASLSICGIDFSLNQGEEKYVTEGPNETMIITLDSFSNIDAKPLLFGMSSESFYRGSTPRPGMTLLVN